MTTTSDARVAIRYLSDGYSLEVEGVELAAFVDSWRIEPAGTAGAPPVLTITIPCASLDVTTDIAPLVDEMPLSQRRTGPSTEQRGDCA